MICPVHAQSDEGYGETEEALGQFVDSFETSGNVSVTVNVIRNATLEAMELNITIPGIEDFTTYSESDPDNVWYIMNSTHINCTQLRRQDEGAIYHDAGVGAIEDIFLNFVYRVGEMEAGDSSGQGYQIIMCFSQAIGSFADIWASDAQFISVMQDLSDDTQFKMRIQQYSGGVSKYVINFGTIFDEDVNYYGVYKRVGTDVDVWIYSDEARTSLIETISAVVAVDDHYRYIQPMAGWESATDPNDWISAYLSYLEIPGWELKGYFTTVDYLSDPLANGSALVALMNTTIPYNTQILVEFSEDNITWIFNDWQPLFGGFESVELRDLNYSSGFYYRYNLSTTDPSLTPRVYQNRLITTIGNATGAGVPPGPTGSGAIGFIILGLIFIPVLVFLGVRKR